LAARKAKDVELRRAALDAEFQRSMARERTFPPQWPFARLDNQEFCKRVSKVLLVAAKHYSPCEDGNLVLSAPTGRGKTSLALALLYALIERAKAATEPGKTGEFLEFAFVTAPELVQSRRQTKLGSGDEAPLVAVAMSVGLLVLDEIGFELSSEVVFDVLDRRLRALRPTILTTGMKPKEFRERYGDALWRRAAEQGAVIEDW